MDPISEMGIPLATVYVMTVVGLELRIQDFRPILRSSAKLALATASQALLLPLLAFAVITLLDPPLHRKLGLIVIAACPGGALSNFFTVLARGEAALSVALTTVCTLFSVLTLPAVTWAGFALFVTSAEAVRPPVLLLIGQLIALLVLPLIAGMALRRWREPFFERIQRRLQRAGLATVVALVTWILIERASEIAAESLPGALAASLFVVPAMAMGEVLGRTAGMEAGGRLAYALELGFRNLGLAIVVAVTLLGQECFLAFGTVFFLTATAWALALVALLRWRSP